MVFAIAIAVAPCTVDKLIVVKESSKPTFLVSQHLDQLVSTTEPFVVSMQLATLESLRPRLALSFVALVRHRLQPFVELLLLASTASVVDQTCPHGLCKEDGGQ